MTGISCWIVHDAKVINHSVLVIGRLIRFD
jgi:hypothetical protein